MYTFYFEKLDVWQNARQLAKSIYEQTASFPSEEKFGLTNQIRRATLSISANIAEGFSRSSRKDKARFLNQAYSSAWETVNFLILAKDLGFLPDEAYIDLRDKTEKVTNQLNALHRSVVAATPTQE